MITLIMGDITKVAGGFDVIVNAANKTLLGGGGVDGAIHKAAGKELLKECKKFRGCDTGDAKITGAYNLPCKRIIHAVGPDYREVGNDSYLLLLKTYISVFELAKRHGLKKIAMPSISTGNFSVPIEQAARIAIWTGREFLKNNPDFELTWVLFTEEDFAVYREIYSNICRESNYSSCFK